MFDHLGRWLLIIVGTLALLHGASQSGLAQVDVDRELARARNEWMEGTPAARVKTLVRLESLGEDASPAVPILVAALHEPDPSTRVKAAQVLGQVGFRARAAIPELTTLLKDPEPGVRVSAVKALATFDRKAEPSIPALVQSLRAGPDLRCPEAVTVLAAIGDPALPAIADFLKDPDPEIRKTAIRCLAQLPSWHSSGRPGAIAVNLQPRVNALARDPDTGVRIALTQMLAGTMRDSEEAAETLRILFRDPAAEVRLAVVTAMSQQGIVPKIFVPLLLELCKDGDRRVRIAAVGTLPQADVTSATVIDRLLDALRDPDADIRAETAEKLALAYSDGEEMWSTVGREFYVPTSVRKALARTAPARASLKSALADPDCRVRAATASLLPAFQDEAATIVPMLTDRLKDPVASVRAASAAALARFGPAARGATRPLLAMLSHPARFSDGGYLVSTSAAKALVAIGDEAKAKMLRVLLAQLNSLDEPTRKRAAEVLVAVGGKITWDMLHTMAVARTTRCVQVEVLDILSRTIAGHPPRSEVRAIVPVLKTLARDDDAEVRLSALGLLIDIDPVAADIPSRYFAYLRDGQDPNLDEQWFSTTARPAMIPQWIQGLNDQDPKIRVATVTILAVMAEPWAQAPDRRLKIEIVRALVSTLKDTDTRVRWIAAETLGVLKLEAKTVIPALIGMVNTESKPIPADDRITIRSFADRDQPCCLGPRKKGDDTPRVAAIQALGSYGEEAASAVPELVRALRDRDLRVRWFAAEALALIGPEAKDSVPALIEALRSRDVADGAGDLGGVRHEGDGMEDGPIRLMAAVALGKIGTEEAKAAVPDLIKALSGPDSRVRGAAVRALISIGAEPGGMIPELVRLVTQRPVAEVAEEAQDYLVLIGEAAVPPLIEVFRDRDPDARLAAINVLAQIGTTGAGAIPDMIASLKDREIELRVAAAGALGGIARETVAVIPALIAALKDPEEDVSYAACESLNIIGKPALPAVLSLLRDADPVVRERASGALSYMGSSSLGASEELARERRDATRTALRSVLGDRDERVRSGASEAIKSLLPDAVPVLVSALEDPSPAIRIGAARTLGAIGNDARDALGQLRRLQNDPDPGVREAVDAAIRAITNSDPAKP